MGGCFSLPQLSGGLLPSTERGSVGFGEGRQGWWQGWWVAELQCRPPCLYWLPGLGGGSGVSQLMRCPGLPLWSSGLSVLTDTGHPEAVSGRASVWAESRVIQGV